MPWTDAAGARAAMPTTRAAEELELLRGNASWPARVAAAHTIRRELRALNAYAPDMERLGAIRAPVLLVVGDQTEPRRREMFQGLARFFEDARLVVLPGQRHAAHQTAPHLLAAALRDFLLDAQE
jgi:pimeloyl-ACP methyl ester carboxylesterase